MSQNEPSKTPTTIKIAAKEASQRNSANGTADPGPGDPSAAPSVAPQLVDIPAAPTPSQLVVKSTNQPASASQATASAAMSGPQNPESPKVVQDEDEDGEGEVEHPEDGASPSPSTPQSVGAGGPANSTSQGGPSAHLSASPESSPTPDQTGSVSLSKTANAPASSIPHRSTSQVGVSGTKPMGGRAGSRSGTSVIDNGPSRNAEGPVSGPSKVSNKPSSRHSSPAKPDMDSRPFSRGAAASDRATADDKKKKKKTTKFKYHKRIVVRTSGKTSPSTVMDKVMKKDQKVGITPSTIDDLDPQELLKRAGVKGGNKTHWRVRLRQTKRMTKDGKTTTQTKVAYRDSEGNKRVKTSSNPYCKHCGKKLEDCRCENSTNRDE